MKTLNRIFLIDNDQDDGYIFEAALNDVPRRHELLYYRDSEQAITRLSDKAFDPPDMLFIDWNMPKMDGNQCLQMIRKMPGYDKVPIIIYSTSSHPQLQAQAQKHGASYFLAKPSSIQELTEKLGVLLDRDWQSISDFTGIA